MHCQSLFKCFEEICAYADSNGTGYPLVVNTENFSDYQKIMHRLNADDTKQCVYVSDHTFRNGLPNIQEVLDIVKCEGSYVISGISQSLMLQSEEALDREIDELFNFPIKGHVVVVMSHCGALLERYIQRDSRRDRRTILVEGNKSPLPQILIAKDKDECIENYDEGIKNLLRHLEQITDNEIALNPTIFVVTSFSKTFFQQSVYKVATCGGTYDILVQKYTDLSVTTTKTYGNDTQWSWLFKQSSKYSTFPALISAQFGSTSNLTDKLEDTFGVGDDNTKWLLWLALKVFGARENGYFTFVLSNSVEFCDLIHHVYQDLLELRISDARFKEFYTERKQLISHLPENLPEVRAYCDTVGRYGKQAVYYLTDATEDEEYAFLKIVDSNEWADEELLSAVQYTFPELSLYLSDFIFDSTNTKLAESDAGFRKALTKYFHRYKIQKIKNHIEPEFLNEVNSFSKERPFYKLQPRSTVVASMGKKDVQGYFFDALGAEYLAYIQAKCDEYGLIYEVSIAHCELPSITIKNKEFKQYIDTKDISSLDNLKHHSQVYDYQSCKYPIHIFRELEIIDRELRRIRAQLFQNKATKAVILSDHGASRLAVIYEHESGLKLNLEEKGEHSGRCCPCSKDPEIDQAVYEDGYAILANYDRFSGSRKANLEVHGGASLEEVVIPIITLALRPDNVVYYFVDPVVRYKMGQPSIIELFSNVPMKSPRLEVDGVIYDGTFTTDKNHALFVLTEQKRARTYSATIYDGNENQGVALTFRIERGTKTRDLFG